MGSHKRHNESLFVSTSITIFIVAMLMFSAPAQAIIVSLDAFNLDNKQVGETGFFFVNVTIGVNEIIPINSNITVIGLPDISGSPGGILLFNVSDFMSLGSSRQKGNYNISLIKKSGLISSFGYGYGYTNNFGYGYRNSFGYAPFFGYGYGYQFFGYGYGYGNSGYGYNNPNAFTELNYKITMNTAGASAITYNVRAMVNAIDATGKIVSFRSGSTSFKLTQVTGGRVISGRDGGTTTGGVGVTTSEPFENVIKYETRDCSLVAGKPSSCRFTVPEHWVSELMVTGEENEVASFRIEALKGLSPKVPVPAPGTKYLNIWTGSKRIKEALIKFSVENSWIASEGLTAENMRMYNWDGSKWNELDTRILSKDASATNFEAKTSAFSYFAISGIKEAVVPATPSVTTPAVTVTPKVTGTPEMEAAPAPSMNLFLIIIVFIVILAGVVLYFARKQ